MDDMRRHAGPSAPNAGPPLRRQLALPANLPPWSRRPPITLRRILIYRAASATPEQRHCVPMAVRPVSAVVTVRLNVASMKPTGQTAHLSKNSGQGPNVEECEEQRCQFRIRSQAFRGGRQAARQHGTVQLQARCPRPNHPQLHIGCLRGLVDDAAHGEIRRCRRPGRMHHRERL